MQTVEFCCCGCSLRDGTLTLIILGLIGNVVLLLANGGAGIILTIISLIINGLALYGVLKEKPGFLIPTMVGQVISTVVCLIIDVLLVIFGKVILEEIAKRAANRPDIIDIKNAATSVIVLFAVVFLILAVVQYYFFVVVYSYYKKSSEEVRSCA